MSKKADNSFLHVSDSYVNSERWTRFVCQRFGSLKVMLIQTFLASLFSVVFEMQMRSRSWGGGVCVYVNDQWCTNITVKDRFCSKDTELTTNSSEALHHLYLPREFSRLFCAVVYIHPWAHVKAAAASSAKWSTACPSGPLIPCPLCWAISTNADFTEPSQALHNTWLVLHVQTRPSTCTCHVPCLVWVDLCTMWCSWSLSTSRRRSTSGPPPNLPRSGMQLPRKCSRDVLNTLTEMYFWRRALNLTLLQMSCPPTSTAGCRTS